MNWVIVNVLYEYENGKDVIKQIYCCDCKKYFKDVSKLPKIGDKCSNCGEGIGQVEIL